MSEQQSTQSTEQVHTDLPETNEVNVGEELSMEAEIALLAQELETAKSTIDAQKDTVIRAQAEVENIRRRAALDVEKAHKFALEKFANDLLPVIDNLARAVDFADKNNESLKPLIEGIELTQKAFVETVAKYGVEEINPVGQPFNPEHHQAMAMQPSSDHPANTVLVVMQKGYILNGRLLRPAMVMVSKAAE